MRSTSGPCSVQRPMTVVEWAMLIALSVLWGGSFFFNGVAVRALPPFTVVFGRVALAALILVTVVVVLGHKLPAQPRVWTAFFGMALLNNVVPFSLIVWGQSHIASGVASILNATTPLFTVVIAHWSTADEKMTGARLFGVVAGFVGVAVMIAGDGLRIIAVDIAAQLACLAAAVSYAFAGIYGRRFQAMGISPIVTAMGQVTASSLMLMPVILLVDQPWRLAMPDLFVIGALVGVATLSTAAGYILYFRILSTAGATNLLLVTFLIPVSALLLGVMVLGETFLQKHIYGMTMIAIGLAAIDGRPLRLARQLPWAASRPRPGNGAISFPIGHAWPQPSKDADDRRSKSVPR
jgi:drug/metabolite transporter (DMT)-like permease